MSVACFECKTIGSFSRTIVRVDKVNLGKAIGDYPNYFCCEHHLHNLTSEDISGQEVSRLIVCTTKESQYCLLTGKDPEALIDTEWRFLNEGWAKVNIPNIYKALMEKSTKSI